MGAGDLAMQENEISAPPMLEDTGKSRKVRGGIFGNSHRFLAIGGHLRSAINLALALEQACAVETCCTTATIGGDSDCDCSICLREFRRRRSILRHLALVMHQYSHGLG